MRNKHHRKLVVKPPARTTHNTGNPCLKLEVPAAIVATRIGAPASSPNEKQLLITPENTAISRPFLKLNSAIDLRDSSLEPSRSLDRPARDTISTPRMAIAIPTKVIQPLDVDARVPSIPRKIGGPRVPMTIVKP